MRDLYILSKQRIIYMEDKHIKWIYKLKNANDYRITLKHLRDMNARYSIAK